MNDAFLLRSETAKSLYESCRSLPIIDYHCHLSPKEICEDREFDNIGELWLANDHYKWRLMRSFGIPEEKITGDAPMKEKFLSYIAALQYAAGNPLYHWSAMELSLYFGIALPITAENAEAIWQRANACIGEKHLSPVKLMETSGVKIVCTTDDPADPLLWHTRIREKYHSFRVLPSFRTDRLLLMKAPDYLSYIGMLSEAASTVITDLSSLRTAIEKRLLFFIGNGCRLTDLGIADFPDRIYDDEKADRLYRRILAGGTVSDEDYLGILGNLIRYLALLYRKYDLVMQWHFGVARNVNTLLREKLGGDCGADCVADPVKGCDLIRMLDAIQNGGGLPDMILYSLNSASIPQLASVAGSFPRVRLGTAWWFCDHKRGITEQLRIIAENGILGTFPGMLTDSRSFLSFARHDYFRRILCSFIGEMTENGEYDPVLAYELVRRLCCDNTEQFFKGDDRI